MEKGFQIPPAKLGAAVLMCEYLNMHGKTKPCRINPDVCFLGNKGVVSADGSAFTPTEQPSAEATVRNCPKINQ